MKVKGRLHEINVAAVYYPAGHNLKKKPFETFFQILGSKLIEDGDYNSKHILWGSRLTTKKDRELSKVLQEKNYSFLSTGSSTYWPKDGNKIPDILDFFITNRISTTYIDIQASYDLTSDHTPIIATINTSVTVRQPPPRLHNSQTNWEIYRKLVRNIANLAVKLKEREDVELATDNFIGVLQNAAKEATPARNPQDQPITYPAKSRDSWP